MRDTDLILYTPEGAKLIEQKVPANKRIRLEYQIAERSAEMIRAELWDQ